MTTSPLSLKAVSAASPRKDARCRKVWQGILVAGIACLWLLAAAWPGLTTFAAPAGRTIADPAETATLVVSPTVTADGVETTPPDISPTVLVTVSPSLSMTVLPLPSTGPELATPTPVLPAPPAPLTLPVTITATPSLSPVNPGEAEGNGSPAGPLATATPPPLILISEFLYDGLTPSTEGDEFVELCNPNAGPVDLTGYKVGDEAISGGSGSMYLLPAGVTLAPQACLVVAKNANHFLARFNFLPDFELLFTPPDYMDHARVPNLLKYSSWAGGSWSLANAAGAVLVLGPGDEIVDSAAYGSSDYPGLGLEPQAQALQPDSLQRIWPIDTNSMGHDFVSSLPSPMSLTQLPAPPAEPPLPAALPDGMNAYWGQLHAHTSYSDGAGPPFYALAQARAAGLHFYAVTDPGQLLSPAEWAGSLAECQAATMAGQFVAVPGVEWDHPAAGHVTIFYSDNPLGPTDPLLDTLSELYAWLAAHPAVIAQFSHPAPASFDGFAFSPAAAPQLILQEIGYEAAARTRYETAFIQSGARGWRVAPTFSSAGRANWGTDSSVRTGLVAPALTAAGLSEALRARRVFATEDSNLALALRLNGAWMGNVLTATGSLPLTVNVVDPDAEPITLMLYDRNLLLAAVSLASSTGQWSTTVDAQAGHYFWLKAVQADSQAAYSAPVWIAGPPPLDRLYLNELLPAPRNIDWDGSGVADAGDEWIELFNPAGYPLGLGGWQLVDASGYTYSLPLGVAIPAGGFVVLSRSQTNLSLNNNEDSLTLIHPNGTPVDTFRYTRSPGYDGSWCRLPDSGPVWSDACAPSPGAANREKVAPGPLTVSIYEAKRLSRNAWVRVKGRVTVPPGVLGAREMYVQDRTAGILVYLPKDHGLFFNLGDRIEVVGKLKTFHEEFEIAVSTRSDVEFLEPGQPPPPLPIATTSLLEPYEGLLVMLQGQAVQFAGRSTFWVDDGTDPAKVYLDPGTGISKPYLSPGTPVTVVGIVSQYSTGVPSREDYRLLPRYPTDLTLPGQRLPPANWPVTLPETGS